tara:strand:- start:52 stop:927 length:876 start_codon:yes stop_codon:yes gene_type:complete
MKIYEKNSPENFNKENILKYLDEFIHVYRERPIKNNLGGMKFPHMLGFYFLLKTLKPDFVVESGIFKGQSTWLIENTLPKTRVLSIDPNLEQREYISKSNLIEYSNLDFINQDFSNLPKNSLVFFDDHQNFYERLVYSYFFGFKHIIGEDNYPVVQGDTYSFKKIYSGKGLNDVRPSLKNLLKSIIIISKHTFLKKMNKNFKKEIQKYDLSIQDVMETKNHFNNLEKIIDTYFEFPPVFKNKLTRWGDEWTDENYPTKEALIDLNTANIEKYKDIYNESNSYNWMCYIKLK